MFINNSSIIENCIQWPNLPEKDGDILYVHPDNLKEFSNQLASINTRFVLVTCGSDISIPFGIYEESMKILYSEKLICWFAQNAMRTFEKLRNLPIGIDYHTDKTLSKEEQDTLLCKYKNSEKKAKLYGNFQFQMKVNFVHDRQEAIAEIPADIIDYEESRLPKEECYHKMSSYKFIASPFGNGLECHRTWEALALGSIPVLRHSCMDSVYEGLPIILVHSWSEVTRELLDSYEYPKTLQLEKLSVDYWIEQIKEAAKTNIKMTKEEIDTRLFTPYDFS